MERNVQDGNDSGMNLSGPFTLNYNNGNIRIYRNKEFKVNYFEETNLFNIENKECEFKLIKEVSSTFSILDILGYNIISSNFVNHLYSENIGLTNMYELDLDINLSISNLPTKKENQSGTTIVNNYRYFVSSTAEFRTYLSNEITVYTNGIGENLEGLGGICGLRL